MKLYDLMQECEDGLEITVTDKDYDIETYFYSGPANDSWDEAMLRFAKLLDVVESDGPDVAVTNMSELIENKINDLEKTDLFITCDIDSIMDDIESVLAGNVSEKWLDEFVTVLEGV